MLGLATPFKENNYGTKLQAFALQTAVNGLGFETEIIHYGHRQKIYDPKKFLLRDRRANKDGHKGKQQAMEQNPNLKALFATRDRAFDGFAKTYYKFSDYYPTLKEIKENCGKYEAVICGSDQIWLPVHICSRYYTFTHMPKGVKRIAYAPSFGISEIPWFLKSDYKKMLKGFDTVTTREVRGSEMVGELTGTPCPVVADPTLLLTKEQWMEHLPLEEPVVEGDYVFAYFIGANESHRRMAKEYAKKHYCKLVQLPHIDDYVKADETYADVVLYDIAPDQFVSLIRHAKAVVTDSFHGSVFSLIFQKNFYVFERFRNASKGSTNSRIYSLLSLTGLEDRLITSEDGIPEDKKEIPYADVEQRIADLRNKSIGILKKALE